jgi:hypothetical protein
MAKFLRYEPCPRCVAAGRDRRGDNLATYSDGGYHCFSCGLHRGARLPWVEKQKEEVNDPTMLPPDFTREVPTEAWKWLLQYGLSWKYWSPFVGWSEKYSRLVFTVGNPIQFSIGRLIGKEDKRKWFVWGNSHDKAHVIGDDFKSGPVVLVEDIVSAHKVGQVATCIPVFGTRVFAGIVLALRHLGQPVIMWLDEDQRGAATGRATWLSLMTGLPVQYVFTKRDPKELSLEVIKATVNDP